MKKLILMAAMVLASAATYAQHAVGTMTFQPKVGVNIADLTSYGDPDVRIGLAAGVEAEYQASDIFSISGGLLYSMQGAKHSTGTSFMGISASGDVTTKLDYINIPILANVYVAKGLAVKLGIQPAFKVNSSVSGSYNVAGYTGDTEEYDINAEDFDFSIPVGMSYEFNNVVLDARYNWGVTKVFEGSDSKNSVFQITLGYKFEL